MFTKEGIPGLLEATRLTRAGRLLEATALIQRILQENAVASGSTDRGATDNAIDVEFSRMADTGGRELSQPRFLRRWRGRDAAVDAAQTQTAPGAPGQFVSGVYANHAGARAYKLYVPTGYAGQPLPLVVMLHGCTQTAGDFANGTRMNTVAEERQCFVLYPEQNRAANRAACWNWFRRGDQYRDSGEPAILAGMTREVMDRYRIDPTQVFVAGLSAGGAMAAVMGAAYPELYAAVGVHSGLACGSAHDLASAFAAMRGRSASAPVRNADATPAAIPTIVFHGDRDKTVHPRNSEQVVALSVADASAERGQVPGGHAYTRTVHRDANGRVVLEHWLVHGAGHAWFGGSRDGSYVDPRGPDAAREMMRFFLSQRA